MDYMKIAPFPLSFCSQGIQIYVSLIGSKNIFILLLHILLSAQWKQNNGFSILSHI